MVSALYLVLGPNVEIIFTKPLLFLQPLSGERQCFQCQSGEETRTTGAASKDDCRAVNCDSRDLCENGGECVPIQHKAKCYCPAGFTGQYCEVRIKYKYRDLFQKKVSQNTFYSFSINKNGDCKFIVSG